ncbi:MAG: hypothetical protein KDC84_11775 [Crocinitomicaceae bacterium]|nr:hypothetical protein [Crocinitomicaceae bacterium]
MKALLYFFAISLTSIAFSQFPDGVTELKVEPNKNFETKGDLSKGKKIDDLSWASNSSVACFPATQNSKFRGNHVLYGFSIPAYSQVKVTVIPDDKSKDFSIYGYQVGTTNYSVVPNLSSCVSCEAEHKWDYPKRGKTQDHTRSIEFNSIKNPYNIFIGVTGNNGLTSGSFTLKIELVSAAQNEVKQEPVKVFTAESEKGKVLAYQGNLNQGVKMSTLAWASSSSVACFPATQNSKFRGNHVIFTTTIPTRSEMIITVIPKDKSQNMSLYAYEVGMTSEQIVPNLSSCVSCEAEHKWDYPKKGRTQDHTRTVKLNAINNPYKVVIGVAGADGLSEGEFVLKIEVK